MATTSTASTSIPSTTSVPSARQAADQELRAQIEEDLRKLVDGAALEREEKLAKSVNDQEREQIEENYRQQMQSLRIIANDMFKGGRGGKPTELDLRQQQAMLDAAAKARLSNSRHESMRSSTASDALNAVDRNGHNVDERNYAYNAASTSLVSPSLGMKRGESSTKPFSGAVIHESLHCTDATGLGSQGKLWFNVEREIQDRRFTTGGFSP
ncbi:hypothetical protein EIP86_005211 [Pleurotus ostreatoroseus]|nr:hypothetical protein EIP86_005211 [Pleurotus ostreatoroseus]